MIVLAMIEISTSLQSFEQWRDIEFTRVLCILMTSSKMAVDIHIMKILLRLADCAMLAAEIYQRVAMVLLEFINQLRTVQSLEVMRLYITIKYVTTILLTACASHFESTAKD